MPSCRSKLLIASKIFQSIIWGLLSTLICQCTLDHSVSGAFLWNLLVNDIFQMDDEQARQRASNISSSKIISHLVFFFIMFGVIVGFLMWYLEVYEEVQKEFHVTRQVKVERSLLDLYKDMAQGKPIKVTTDEENPLHGAFVEFTRDQKHYDSQTVEWQMACRAQWTAEKAHWEAEKAHWEAEKALAESKAKTEADNDLLNRASLDNLAGEVRKLRLLGIRRSSKKAFLKRKRH